MYRRRVVDDELDELMPSLPHWRSKVPRASARQPRATRRANTVHALDDPAQRSVAVADPTRLVNGDPPILIDEWRHVPESWDLVRRAVDEGAPPGRFRHRGYRSPRGAARRTERGPLRFWDSSTLVPLVLNEQASTTMEEERPRDPEITGPVVPDVECESAIARSEREGAMSPREPRSLASDAPSSPFMAGGRARRLRDSRPDRTSGGAAEAQLRLCPRRPSSRRRRAGAP